MTDKENDVFGTFQTRIEVYHDDTYPFFFRNLVENVVGHLNWFQIILGKNMGNFFSYQGKLWKVKNFITFNDKYWDE